MIAKWLRLCVSYRDFEKWKCVTIAFTCVDTCDDLNGYKTYSRTQNNINVVYCDYKVDAVKSLAIICP